MEIEDAVSKAISEMPEDYIIKPFLDAHRSEVYGMLLTEYNEAEAMELFKEDGRREGMKEGMKKGIKEGIHNTLISLVHDGILTINDAAVRANMSEESFAELLSKK